MILQYNGPAKPTDAVANGSEKRTLNSGSDDDKPFARLLLQL